MTERFTARRIIAPAMVGLLSTLAVASCAAQETGDKRTEIVQGLISDGYTQNDFVIGAITRTPTTGGTKYTADVSVKGCNSIVATIEPVGTDEWTVIDRDFQPESPAQFIDKHGC